ncbi:MAG: hypothetical protein ABJO88_02150 [Parasphingorhabdus sp.]
MTCHKKGNFRFDSSRRPSLNFLRLEMSLVVKPIRFCFLIPNNFLLHQPLTAYSGAMLKPDQISELRLKDEEA